MKEVMAFIRMNKVNQTKEALNTAGFPSVTCRKVLGRGKKKVEYSVALLPESHQEAAKEAPILAETISEEHRLIPKRFLTLVVRDDEVERAIDAIMAVNSTGNPGDGKIFILPIAEAYRVRTGETGEEAI
ncbi:P-II family nitrogen regulator [Heliobacterium gestii]|uniref:P-II family nitrogen regulator n=1 Tax=Heliomicrobium gestii TaxID=2699 RepID=A0A845L9Q0_HELGE|nr:P-II family nitrogen regulator [Heliomicrobium gestii]MBM7866268.1 nitrogen regulatory protein PII 2 [Heliomicrobium gestii]MZP42938.1 P-II family nitrogen regulator [Heliomicrobium gestii]